MTGVRRVWNGVCAGMPWREALSQLRKKSLRVMIVGMREFSGSKVHETRFQLPLALHRCKRREPPSRNPVLVGNEVTRTQLCLFSLT